MVQDKSGGSGFKITAPYPFALGCESIQSAADVDIAAIRFFDDEPRHKRDQGEKKHGHESLMIIRCRIDADAVINCAVPGAIGKIPKKRLH